MLLLDLANMDDVYKSICIIPHGGIFVMEILVAPIPPKPKLVCNKKCLITSDRTFKFKRLLKELISMTRPKYRDI